MMSDGTAATDWVGGFKRGRGRAVGRSLGRGRQQLRGRRADGRRGGGGAVVRGLRR